MAKNINKLQQVIDEYVTKFPQPKILEAGCGSISKINLGNHTHITGIDISEKQLERNTILNEKIHGDIQYYKFNEETYDIIVCWHVLEHLSKPKLAINNFFHSIKKNGLIILSSPNPLSIKGLITKFTPHWFHVFVYRYIYGIKDAGKNDTAPFPTQLRFFMAPRSLSKYAKNNGVSCLVEFSSDALNGWVGDSIKNKMKLGYYILLSLKKMIRILSFNKIGESEYILVLKK